MNDPSNHSLESPVLAFGFIGDRGVHRDNAQALLEDLIQAHRRDNKLDVVRFVLQIEPFTPMIADLIEYGLGFGYDLELVGHVESFKNKEVAAYISKVEKIVLASEVSVPKGVVNRVGLCQSPRLILLSDPASDDRAYEGLHWATAKDIPVRYLLDALDMVLFEENEKEQPTMASRNDDDINDALEEEDDEVDDEIDLEDGDDGEDLNDGEDLDEEEPDEEEPDEEEVVVPKSVAKHRAAKAPAKKAPAKAPAKKAPVKALVKAPVKKVPAKAPVKAAPVTDGAWTASKLQKLADSDRDAFWKVASKHKIYPGRGIKVAAVISRILGTNGAKAPAKRVAPVKAPAKKAAPAAKKTAVRTTKLNASQPAGISAKQLKRVVKLAANAILDAIDALES